MDISSAKIGDRTLFPHLECQAYLAHSSISPVSALVRQRLDEVLASYEKFGVAAFDMWLPCRAVLRERLARLSGAVAEDIALVPNTTQGVLSVALCFPWDRGDRVLTFDGEFPANVTPWQRAAELYGLDWQQLPRPTSSRSAILESLREALEDKSRAPVRLVAASLVEFQTGLLMPIAEIAELCHSHGAALCVDGIQGLGVIECRAREWGIDFLACGAHKWLMGVEGAGFLYISSEWLPRLRPVMAGWLSLENTFDFLHATETGALSYARAVRREANFVELGTGNTLGYVALETSTAIIEQLGRERIYAHVSAYLDRLERGLQELGFLSQRSRPSSAILSLRPPQGTLSNVQWAEELGKKGIICSCPEGYLRFAPHWHNRMDEVDYVVATVSEILAKG